ncbi:hypothetical protein ACFVMC_28920 [Nocardia sp. NPDC127579]|uniref:hypothetical protein n=1 Tax=Nocardia sp. NPDC127579 TaxID=3345402 RepID=UPI003627AA15
MAANARFDANFIAGALNSARRRLDEAAAIRVEVSQRLILTSFEITADHLAHGEITADSWRVAAIATPDTIVVNADSMAWLDPAYESAGARLVGNWMRPVPGWDWCGTVLEPGLRWHRTGQSQKFPYLLDALRPATLVRAIDRLLADLRRTSGRDEHGRALRRTVSIDPDRGVLRVRGRGVRGRFALDTPHDPLSLTMRWRDRDLTVHIVSTTVDAQAVRAKVFDVLRPVGSHARVAAPVVRRPPSERAGEQEWIPPAEWRQHPIPFRGDGSALSAIPHAATAQRVTGSPVPAVGEAVPATLHWNLTVHPPGSVVESPALSPLGSAMLHALIRPDPWIGDPPEATVDDWVTAYGLPTACEAAVRLLGLQPIGRAEAGGIVISQQVREMCDDHPGILAWFGVLDRVREHLAVAEHLTYRDSVDRLAAIRARSNHLWIHIAAAYLIPERQDWVDAVLARTPGHGTDPNPYAMLGNSISTRAQLDRLLEVCGHQVADACMPALIARLGPDAAVAVAWLLDTLLDDPAVQRPWARLTCIVEDLAGLLALMPTDEAFELLLDRIDQQPVHDAIHRATARFPHRAARLLAQRLAAKPDPTLETLLRTHLRTHPDLTTAIEPIQTDLGIGLPIAEAAALPPILVAPPWTRPRPRRQPPVPGLERRRPLALRWTPGERAEWAESTDTLPYRRMLGTFETDVLDEVFAAASKQPITLAATLAPVHGTAVTELFLDIVVRTRASGVARTWFQRHADTAVHDLIPIALGTTRRRRPAETVLRLLYDRGHASAIAVTAAEFGTEAAGAVHAIVRGDRTLLLPKRIPPVPDWLDLDRLPRIRLYDHSAVFPDTAACTLIRMLRLCDPDTDYPGIRTALAAADPVSLAEFGRDLFDMWRRNDYPGSPFWPAHAQALLGDDETARRLGKLTPASTPPAVTHRVLEALARMNTETARQQISRVVVSTESERIRRHGELLLQ